MGFIYHSFAYYSIQNQIHQICCVKQPFRKYLHFVLKFLNCNNFCLQRRLWETSKKVDHKSILHEKSFVLVALEENLQKNQEVEKWKKKHKECFLCA